MKIILRVIIYSFLLLVLLTLLDPYGSFSVFAIPHFILFLLSFGWIAILLSDIPKLHWNAGMILFSVFLYSTMIISFHLAAKRWHLKWNIPKWRIRWTISFSLIILFSIVAGFSMTGISHQLYWMTIKDDNFFSYQNGSEPARRTQSKNNLKQVGLAAHNFHDVYISFPSYGCDQFTHYGFDPKPITSPASWETKLLPFIEHGDLYDQIDFTVPWDDSKNKDVFQTLLPVLLHPAREYHTKKEDQYASSHYSANTLIFARSDNFQFNDIKDGTSHTIMSGEISENLPAWGKPQNWRDPRIGLNSPKKGFKGPHKSGTHILLADGTARFLSNDIDPKVLKALSTPNGGETQTEF